MTAFSEAAFLGQSRIRQAIEQQEGALSPAEARTAQFLLHHESALAFETGASIARKAGVSEITVSRLLRRLGFQGMAGLKSALQEDQAAGVLGAMDMAERLFSSDYGAALQAEAQALMTLSEQVASPGWEEIVSRVAAAPEVHVTGFQTVRGMSEDFARRLALVRPTVRHLPAHDNALTEWIDPGDGAVPSGLLVLIDVVPYAREAEALARLSRERGLELVIFTDEFNTWAGAYTENRLQVRTRSGLFLESTGTITTALNLLVHGVALRNPEAAERRIRSWQSLVGELDLFAAPSGKTEPQSRRDLRHDPKNRTRGG